MKTMKLLPREKFTGFVSLFNNKTKNFYKFINASGPTLNGFGSPNTILNYSVMCMKESCQWVSPNSKDESYIVFSFSCPIYLSHYTLQTRKGTKQADNYPVSWSVQSSNTNNNDWQTIDTRTNRTELIGTNNSYTYGVDGNCAYARYIKVVLTKTSNENVYHFHLSKVDFFGEMDFSHCSVPFRIALMTCNSRKKVLFTPLFFLFCVYLY